MKFVALFVMLFSVSASFADEAARIPTTPRYECLKKAENGHRDAFDNIVSGPSKRSATTANPRVVEVSSGLYRGNCQGQLQDSFRVTVCNQSASVCKQTWLLYCGDTRAELKQERKELMGKACSEGFEYPCSSRSMDPQCRCEETISDHQCAKFN